MSQDRLNGLATCSIEKDILEMLTSTLSLMILLQKMPDEVICYERY
jgi:hypothetical protein